MINVAIFGSGIAGLTAAHELARRGFGVYLFDPATPLGVAPADPDPDPTQPDNGYAAGGVARTQFHLGSLDGIFQSQPNPVDGTTGAFGLPGEHGFRFFPSFYRHLTDQMSRVPIEDIDGISGQPRAGRFLSTADNLLPTTVQGISTSKGNKLYTYSRTAPTSFAQVQDVILRSMEGFGYRALDLNRFLLKMIQFMTSCKKRRLAEYAPRTWWDYLGGDLYDPTFRKHINSVTRALVAMDAEHGDALTQGDILVQLMLDQLGDGRATDRVLDGPTSEQWLKHWFRFLEDGGQAAATFPQLTQPPVILTFANQALQRFDLDAQGNITQAWVGAPGATDPSTWTAVTADDGSPMDYFVIATDLGAIAAGNGGAGLVTQAMADADAAQHPGDPMLQRLRQLAYGVDRFSAWLAGIQFYLSEDIQILPGHVYFPDSAWGLSAISQVQFWGADSRARYGGGEVRGILSVIIADWDTPGGLVQKPARRCNKLELGMEVWNQLQVGLLPASIQLNPWTDPASPPVPYLDHHVDAMIVDAQHNPVCNCLGTETVDRPVAYNRQPVFICPPGSFELRPGPLEGGYSIRLGKLVFAGAYTQTYTRLPTMEAANESARHAVNAILADVESKLPPTTLDAVTGVRYERCPIYPLEDFEPGDLSPWKKIDEMLFDLGDPHMIEILGVEKILDAVMASHVSNTPVVERIFELLSRHAPRGPR
jgi:uncharacterized protein with NAD-binding domain and iron-sulfur cluster